jgi:hypothetical protein
MLRPVLQRRCSREALALLRRQQGRPAEAAALLERLVATAEKVYGPDHPELARTLLNLGLVRQDLGADANRPAALRARPGFPAGRLYLKRVFGKRRFRRRPRAGG